MFISRRNQTLALLTTLAIAACSRAIAPTAAPTPPVLPATAAPASSTELPTSLSDQEFWKLLSDISEPGGFFRSDNFLSNEAGFQYVIPELLRVTRRGDVYLGVGPEQNFTYIAALQPKLAIIFDIRRGNLHMHLLYKALFEMSADRAEFVSRLFSKPRPAGLDSTTSVDSLFAAYWNVETDSGLYRRNLAAVKAHLITTHGFALGDSDVVGIQYVYDAFYFGGPRIDYSYPRSGGGNRSMPNYTDLMIQNDGQGVRRSFLATEARWRAVRELERKNLIVPVVGDFGGPRAIRAVGEYLKQRHATVAAIYTSNVEQYLFQSPDAWRKYYENVATLPLDSTSTFIRSIGGGFGMRPPPGAPFGRLASVLCPIDLLLAAYREGRITGYYDVIQMSH